METSKASDFGLLKPFGVRKKGRTRVVNKHGMRRCQRLPVSHPVDRRDPCSEMNPKGMPRKMGLNGLFSVEMSKYVDAWWPLEVNPMRRSKGQAAETAHLSSE
jgi:hypothetical protein